MTLQSFRELEGEAVAMHCNQRSRANILSLAPKLSKLNCLVPFYFVSGINLVQSYEIKRGGRGTEGCWSAIKKPAFTPAGEVEPLVFSGLS